MRKLRTPAEVVIEAFGGVTATALAIGRHKSTVAKWAMSKAQQGTDGKIPTNAQQDVLNAARKHGVELTESDLIWGRVIKSPRRVAGLDG